MSYDCASRPDRDSSALHLGELAPLVGRRGVRLLGLLALLFDLEGFKAGGSIDIGLSEAGSIERNNFKHRAGSHRWTGGGILERITSIRDDLEWKL